MAELQEDLSEDQADKALDATKDALDDMKDAYRKEKDDEITILKDKISSYQKLYDMAIEYITNKWETDWDSLLTELTAWNKQYGNELQSTIKTAWENALAAAKRYGNYVSALNSVGTDINAASGGSNGGNSNNIVVGSTNYDNSSSTEEEIHAAIREMYQNAQEWHTASENRQRWLSDRNKYLGEQRLKELGINAERKADGAWYVGNELLFEKYRKYIYHTGGFVGDEPLKPNERYIKAENGELVLTSDQQDSFAAQIERMEP